MPPPRASIYFFKDQNDVVDFLPKVKIEIVIDDNLLEEALSCIENSAKTGRIGDGKIFVSDLGQVIRIRTGETGNDAL